VKKEGPTKNSGFHLTNKERTNTLAVSDRDSLILHSWAERDNTTMTAQTHFAILTYSLCRNNNHAQRIKELEDQVRLLALTIRKYQIRCGEVVPEKK